VSAFLFEPVAVIGLGRIGTSLALALSKEGYRVLASTAHPERHRDVESSGIEILPSEEAASRGSVVVIAVKPKQIMDLADEIRERVRGKLVISLAASLTTEFLEKLMPGARIVRAMPNLALIVGESITALSPGRSAREPDIEVAKGIFSSVGECVVVEEELMDAVTGLSGSGPAYVFMMVEALADAGVRVGLARDLAIRMAAKTLLGASKMVLTGKHPAELRDMVLTPGGVTIAGLHELERRGFRAALMNAVLAAVRRAEELRNELPLSLMREVRWRIH